MNILRNLIIVILLGAVAWWLYGSFNQSDHPVPQDDASLPFAYEATTTTYHVSIDLPATDNEALDKAVRAHANVRIAEFDDMYGPSAFSPEDMEMSGFIDREMRYEMMISGEPWSTGGLNGMIVQEYDFTGGAHGGVSLTAFIYDDAAREIHLADLFVPGAPYLERIAQAVVPRLKADLEENQIFNQEMFEAGTKAVVENYAFFSLDDSSITFYFNQYQVAPYVAGIREVSIPLSELDDILSPEYF